MRKTAAFAALLFLLAGCAKHPPVGKWEGGYDSGGTIVVARVEIGADGLVKLMAPDVTGLVGAKPEETLNARAQAQSDLVNGWAGVTARQFDFDGKTFRKPGGQAPQMVWDKDTNQMTLEIYIGRNPALPVTLRPVDGFHDDPFGSG
jgi:hypothetical protein